MKEQAIKHQTSYSNLFDDSDFRAAILQKRPHYIGNIGNPKFSMYQMSKLIPDHKKEWITFDDKNERLLLTGCESRGMLQKNLREIIEDLERVFLNSTVSLHMYSTYGTDRATIHQDEVDVVYLQSVGEVDWSIHESDEPNAELTELWRLQPGDLFYTPKMTAHCVTPLGHSRLGLSYGINGYYI